MDQSTTWGSLPRLKSHNSRFRVGLITSCCSRKWACAHSPGGMWKDSRERQKLSLDSESLCHCVTLLNKHNAGKCTPGFVTYSFCFKHMCASFSYSFADRASVDCPCGSSLTSGWKQKKNSWPSCTTIMGGSKTIFCTSWWRWDFKQIPSALDSYSDRSWLPF